MNRFRGSSALSVKERRSDANTPPDTRKAVFAALFWTLDLLTKRSKPDTSTIQKTVRRAGRSSIIKKVEEPLS